MVLAPQRPRMNAVCGRLLATVVLAATLARPASLRAGASVDAPPAVASKVPEKAPATWGDGIDRLVADALAQGKLPGCVVTVGRASGVVYHRAFGSRALLPAKEPMTEDTIFDLASLTKPIATATALMVLVDRGKLDLDERASRYLPEFASHGKAGVTLRQLLTHVSGLPAETPIGDYERGRAEAMRRIMALQLKATPGEGFTYSDIGYLVIEEVIRRVTGTGLADLADAEIFRPLGMGETRFLPPASVRLQIAPTEQRNGMWIRGDVHDPRAFRLGGVAGHAGLFSTAADLARFARMVLGDGTLDGARILSARAIANMVAPHDVAGGIRALGWDVQTPYSTNRGSSLSRRAVGHGGYTGTSLWIDPEKNLFVIFLSNRVHPDGKGSVNALAAAIATLAGTALGQPTTPERVPAGTGTAAGIDVLAAQNFARLRGLQRVVDVHRQVVVGGDAQVFHRRGHGREVQLTELTHQTPFRGAGVTRSGSPAPRRR